MTTKNSSERQQLIPNAERIPEKSLDDLYIKHYLDNPQNKTLALKNAMEEGKFLGAVYRQRANELHNRLKHKINKALDERIMSGAALGYSVLFELAVNGDNDNVRAACASKLIEYAGKNKPSEAPQSQDRGDIKQAIEQTRARIYQLTGKQEK